MGYLSKGFLIVQLLLKLLVVLIYLPKREEIAFGRLVPQAISGMISAEERQEPFHSLYIRGYLLGFVVSHRRIYLLPLLSSTM